MTILLHKSKDIHGNTRRIVLCFGIFFVFNLIFFLSALSALSAQESESELPAESEPLPVEGPVVEKNLAPINVSVSDIPNDAGRKLLIEWNAPPDAETADIVGYDIYRAEQNVPAAFVKINNKLLAPKVFSYEDRHVNRIGGNVVQNGKEYFYQVAALTSSGSPYFSDVFSGTAESTVFNTRKTNSLIFVALYVAIILFTIRAAKSGKSTYIRRLAGVDAIEEAVGRATEMGKPVMYICGLEALENVSTIAAINILSGVAKKVANYQSRLILPCRDPMVMTVAQEVVKEAYLAEGRPDAYREEDIYYTTYDQFPYVASVDGIMLREKPATNLYMGYYYAESLILAETGASAGAIQIAGTDAVTQLPFFVTACDYTLIGEELYAASAYISDNPLLIGSLKGQDYMKFFLGICILLGIILFTFFEGNPFVQTFIDFLNPLTSG